METLGEIVQEKYKKFFFAQNSQIFTNFQETYVLVYFSSFQVLQVDPELDHLLDGLRRTHSSRPEILRRMLSSSQAARTSMFQDDFWNRQHQHHRTGHQSPQALSVPQQHLKRPPTRHLWLSLMSHLVPWVQPSLQVPLLKRLRHLLPAVT